MHTFYLLSLGCSKNTVDSESMGQLLREYGLIPKKDPAEADLLIVNTCGFIQPARLETIESLKELANNKRPDQMLIAAGCMTQLYADDVILQVPQVDGVLGSRQWMNIVPLVERLNRQRSSSVGRKESSLYQLPVFDTNPTATARQVAIQGTSAYLKIAEGCRRACAYCAIPLIKGGLVSRPKHEILSDARYLQAQGVKEINLIAQDTTDYGKDQAGEYHFTRLIQDVLSVTPDVPWIRMLYAFPGCINDEFIKLMAENPRFLPYLDIPLQHAHPEILRSMNRPANIDHTRTQLTALRNAVENLVLRTTFIIGYPGEGENEFLALLDFVKEMQFDRVGVFPFYFESGTPSAPLGDPVPTEVKQDRIDRLMTVQQQISLAKNQAWVGKDLLVLIEGIDDVQKIAIGRSFRDAPEIDGLVFIEGNCSPGDMVQVRITDAMPYDLVGHLVRPKSRKKK
ncbi:MAG: 30S ribosomal protein S12 methylthiotransferase RimO [Anaerolineae bacterium]|nr:30S ribosomal protein S12 methylthiotransferase RimO [Anaerolineae bacterium]